MYSLFHCKHNFNWQSFCSIVSFFFIFFYVCIFVFRVLRCLFSSSASYLNLDIRHLEDNFVLGFVFSSSLFFYLFIFIISCMNFDTFCIFSLKSIASKRTGVEIDIFLFLYLWRDDYMNGKLRIPKDALKYQMFCLSLTPIKYYTHLKVGIRPIDLEIWASWPQNGQYCFYLAEPVRFESILAVTFDFSIPLFQNPNDVLQPRQT